jgi:sulfur carrier protein
MIQLRINGADAELAVTTVAELLAARGVDPKARFLAVAVNGNIVRRTEWPSATLSPGDDVEIVRPLQGG